MTEADWLDSDDALAMLRFLGEGASRRKRQLFALGCFAHAREVLDEWGLRGLETLRNAREDENWMENEDGLEEAWGDVDDALSSRFWRQGALSGAICRDEDLWDAVEEGRETALTDWDDAGAVEAGATFIVTAEAVNDGYVRSLYGIHPPLQAAQIATRMAANVRAAGVGPLFVWKARLRLFADLLRDVFGNPFRSVSPDPACLAWNSGTVLGLAWTLYEERDFTSSRMGILADALEEAGCAEPAILGHCRSEGPHTRGCWLVDRLLGKE